MKKIAELRKAGQTLGREALARRALKIARQILEDGSLKQAIHGAGQMAAIARACTYDDYWGEKAGIGQDSEERGLINAAYSQNPHI